MVFEGHRLWQVSVVSRGTLRREYHVFSRLSKATTWIKFYVMKCVEEYQKPPLDSMNIQVYARDGVPRVIDGIPFPEWCRKHKYKVPKTMRSYQDWYVKKGGNK